MTDEVLEEMVEEIMRTRGDANYEDYNNEELREHYREILRKDED